MICSLITTVSGRSASAQIARINTSWGGGIAAERLSDHTGTDADGHLRFRLLIKLFCNSQCVQFQINAKAAKLPESYSTGKELAKSISSTLRELLGERYNRQVRPGFGLKPVEVELNLSVLNIGPVDEMTMVR